MQDVLAFVAVLALFAVVLGGLMLLALRVRRRGLSGSYSLMGPFDELWHPAAVQARVEIQVQDERADPLPAPGDRLI